MKNIEICHFIDRFQFSAKMPYFILNWVYKQIVCLRKCYFCARMFFKIFSGIQIHYSGGQNYKDMAKIAKSWLHLA